MNVVEMKTSSPILFSVIWFPDCPDDGDAITDYTRTENSENTQPASTCSNLSRVHSSVIVPPPRLLATGKVWETKLSTLLVRKLCLNWK